ncbi:MAG: flagellar basal body P-ring formation chaperone FlgA [Planctomycetota bacterium]|jgi:flagella basal body P-ring formation protein FlgA|nr:flagellar basal body P-ring formation chaperone FlgA [Planctomycetota bacterium]
MRQFIGITLLSIMLLANPARAEVVVILRQSAEASGNYIRIADIARLEGPREQVLAVAKTVLGPTPPRGEWREINRWEIEQRLLEMGITAEVSLTGNELVRVRGNALQVVDQSADWTTTSDPAGLDATLDQRQPERRETNRQTSSDPELPGKTENPSARLENRPAAPATLSPRLREEVEKAVSSYLSDRYQRSDVEVVAKLLDNSLILPEGAHDFTVVEALEGRLPGRVTLSLKARDNSGRELPPLAVSANAEVWGLAPVAARALYKGDVLKAQDAKVTRIKMEAGNNYLAPDPRAVAGREVRRPLNQGEAILATDTQELPAVRRGSPVTVEAVGRAWKVQALAKALADGKIGDLIMVEDSSSKIKYQARVSGIGKVTTLSKP